MVSAFSTQDLVVDHALAEIAQSFRFLLDVTPVDADAQRAAFASGAREPDFHYRELEDDPEVVTEMLSRIDLSEVEDPILGKLLRDRHRELSLQVAMLAARNSADFLPLSLELYGGVSPALRDRAMGLLEGVSGEDDHGPWLDASEFAALADAEIRHYRAQDPDIAMHVVVRPDVAGVLVSGCDLLVADTAKVRECRVEALLQHEVGTHLVTRVNGSHQPIQLLAVGMAAYEETQEGLAILAEFLVGGLTAFRMRQLAARVVAVDRMVSGHPFAEVHDCLRDLGFAATSAFSTTMRAFRSGGFTKDAIYLRGLLDVLEHLARGGVLDSLWLGKFSLRDLPLIDDLCARDMLVPPKVVPRYLERPETAARLRRAAELIDITDLIGSTP